MCLHITRTYGTIHGEVGGADDEARVVEKAQLLVLTTQKLRLEQLHICNKRPSKKPNKRRNKRPSKRPNRRPNKT